MAATDRLHALGFDPRHALDDRDRLVTTADRQVLAVIDPLAPLLPGGGLRRGTVVAVAAGDRAATSLALALVAAASGQGSWVAIVGLPTVGLAAAAELGVALDRLALIAPPDRGSWSSVVAALVDAVDLVVVGPARVRAGDARRLAARARERGSVLVPVGVDWPEVPDLTLAVEAARWQGLGQGHGHLSARRATVSATGRREAARTRSAELWLPAAGGDVVAVDGTGAEVRPLRPVPAAGP